MMKLLTRKMNTRHCGARCAGFSLIELMIAMSLGVVLTGGIASIVINTSESHRELDKNSRQLENGRYAIQALRDDIRHAGFYGEYYDLSVPGSAPSPCATGTADLLAGTNLPVQGYAGAGSSPLACLPDYVAGTDVLAIRRASTVTTALADLQASDIYLQSRPDRIALENASDTSVFDLTKRDGTTLADIRKYLVHIYYIRSCSNCAGSGDGIPTLTRVELDGGNLNTVSPIAEGIEKLEFRYGIDDTGNGAPDRYVTLPSNLTEWSNVVTVDANLLARNVEETTGHTDTKSFLLGDVPVSAQNDGYKRHVFGSLVRVVNASARREI